MFGFKERSQGRNGRCNYSNVLFEPTSQAGQHLGPKSTRLEILTRPIRLKEQVNLAGLVLV